MRIVGLLAPVMFAACVVAGVGAQAPIPLDQLYAEALQQGEDALAIRHLKTALEAFGRANKHKDNKSAEAFYGISRAFHALGDFSREATACKNGLKYVGADDRLAAMLHNARGSALFALARKNTDKLIMEAEAEFRTALALPTPPPTAAFNLGVVLLRQSRDDEGIPMLKTYVAAGPKSAEFDLARRLIENPRRARENFAPEFRLTTLIGDSYSLSDLAGKTVFLDFWGQWCGPCRAITPNLVALYSKFRHDPNFVMIGISSDTKADEQKWKNYIADKRMDWPQFLDLRRDVIPRFEIRAYPTGIVIGPDGVILHIEVGGGAGGVKEIEGVIKKSLGKTNN